MHTPVSRSNSPPSQETDPPAEAPGHNTDAPGGAPAAPSPTGQPGSLGRYRITGELGGGMERQAGEPPPARLVGMAEHSTVDAQARLVAAPGEDDEQGGPLSCAVWHDSRRDAGRRDAGRVGCPRAFRRAEPGYSRRRAGAGASRRRH